ncbi:MAG: ABC transporter permease [Candidatus Diapherotrites archaeon]|nr:ABC transporter permease [Candidatus Diapherotrites archaeon]
MNLLDLAGIAVRNTLSQGLRSYLTILGVIIGITTIMVLVSLGQGLNTAVEKQFQSIGLNTVMVEPGSAENFITSALAKLREKDISIIESIPGVQSVFPLYETSGTITRGNESSTLFIVGVNGNDFAELERTGYVNIQEGRNLSPGDKYAMVIYDSFAKDAFKNPLQLREKVEMKGKKFRIAGISKPSQAIGGGLITNIAFMPSDTVKELFGEKNPTEIAVTVADKDLIGSVSARMEDRLERAHGEKDFYLLSAAQLLDTAKNVLGIIQLFLLGIAGISLLVGGIGIMNTMIMSVIQRTQEIGLMKAIGATHTQIQTLFLIEAATIGLLGGIIGVCIGYLFSLIISTVARAQGIELDLTISALSVAGIFAFASGVGIVSGFIPARRAAELDPVNALRYE